jgi:predicted CXXCH cytochrome family protein
MKKTALHKRLILPLSVGLLVGIAAMLLTVGLASAASPLPVSAHAQGADAQWCGECHLNIASSWENSTHAHAYNDPFFQERWQAMGSPGSCLGCHTTNYQASSGEFAAAGVSCEACHGQVNPDHPPAPAPVKDDAAYCGTCHTTTLGEWRLTGHAAAGVGCSSCHDVHSQKAMFEDPDEMCINCHKDSMGPYLEDLHIQKDIGCVDCHALVIPPEVPPADGIVPTGHAFTITPGTCVACHTDALHAGFHLPGYEKGAKDANNHPGETGEPKPTRTVSNPELRILDLETQLIASQAAVASRTMTMIFQGGVVGLVLGGSTAWVIANNVRRGRKEEDEAEDES